MTVGVIVTAFGFLEDLDDVGPYLARITGREPSPQAVAELRSRYEAIGGPGPLAEVTRGQVGALAQALGRGFDVRLGCRNSPPRIPEVARDLGASVDRVVVLALAPQENSRSVQAYLGEAREALEALPEPPATAFVRSYPTHPDLVAYWAAGIRRALTELGPGLAEDAHVLFTVHGLPASVVEAGDPYPEQCRATCEAVARAAGLDAWSLSYQSGHPGWLEPDAETALETVAGSADAVVVAPVGFVAEHLETRYDLDVELAGCARELGLPMRRVQTPGMDPRFIACLADVVRTNVPPEEP